MSDINIFELATRKSLRYPTGRGAATTEDLWHMPLTSKTGFDLDSVAKLVNGELKSVSEESFVATNKNPRAYDLELALEVIKYIIAYKLAEEAKAKDRAAKTLKRNKLIEQLGKKQDAAIEQLSEEEIKKQLAALDD